VKAISLGYPPGRIITFPWGVDIKHFTPTENGSHDSVAEPGDENNRSSLRDRMGWRGRFILLSTRGWEPIYGLDVLAQAFVQAARHHPELGLLLLGGGSQAQKLYRIFMHGGVMDRVYFGGQVSQRELPHYFRAADLYMSASYSDGTSISLLEALACGTPALVSDIPGNREWISPGVQGWLFSPGDSGAMAEGILQAVEQRQSLPTIGQAARNLAEKRANWELNFQTLFKAYQIASHRR
jgi:glycosyltransferase involved in cell wall biosynthesis